MRTLFDEQSRQLRHSTMLLDVSLTALTLLAAYALRSALLPASEADLLLHMTLLVIVGPLWLFLLKLCGAYRSPRATSPWEHVLAVGRAIGTGLAILLALVFLLKLQFVSRVVLTAFAVLNFAVLSAVRGGVAWYHRRSLRRGLNFRRVLIVGSGNRARHLAETVMRNSERGIHIVGHLDPDATRVGDRVVGSPVVGTIDDISSVLKHQVIDEVILAVPRAMIQDVEKIARACEDEGVRFLMMADVFEVNVARMRLVQFGRIPLLTFEPVAQEEWKLFIKRAMDLMIVLLTMPLLLPLMAVLAVAIKLDTPGPVFFVQERVGWNKRRFRMFKFRSMVQDGERLQAQLEHLNEAKGPIFKIANDPRVTRIGWFLRRTSLDELPQIFNVVKGDMSLVGPRPMSLRDVDLFDRGIQRKRFSVKPGLTCLWQISGRSQLPFSRWLELDLTYIEQWSLSLDIKILFRTIPVVLKGTGAV